MTSFGLGRDDFAEIDLAHAEPSGERRLDPFLVDDGLRLQDLGARLVELRLPLIDILLRADLPRAPGAWRVRARPRPSAPAPRNWPDRRGPAHR